MPKNKKVIALKGYKPGLVIDAPITANPGYTIFKNFLVNELGLLTKRNGWQTLIGYGNSNLYNGCNIVPVFDNPDVPTGALPWDIGADKVFLHAKTIPTTVDGKVYNDVHILHAQRGKLPNNAYSPSSMIVKTILRKISESQWNIISSTVISPPMATAWNITATRNGFLPSGNTKAVDTNDNTYIFDGWRDGDTCNAVMQYNWYLPKHLHESPIYPGYYTADTDSIYNVSVGRETPIRIEVVTTTGPKVTNDKTSPAGYILYYWYKVLPVYSSGAVGEPSDPEVYGAHNSLDPNVNMGLAMVAPNKGVRISVPATRATDIIGWRIYRTKASLDSGSVTNTFKNRFFFVCQADVPPVPWNANNPWMVLENTTASNGDPRLTDGLDDYALGDELIASDCINSFRHTYGAEISAHDVSGVWVQAVPRVPLPDYKLADPFLSERCFMKEYPDEIVKYGAPIRAVTGTYANGSMLMGGDPKYPKFVYVSDEGVSNKFSAGRTLTIPTADIGNQVQDIITLGQYVYVFLQKGIYRLRPALGTDVPYYVELLSDTDGCDDTNSVTVCNNTAMWVYNGMIFMMDTAGRISSMSNITSVLSDISAKGNSHYMLSPLPSLNGIRISVPLDIDSYNKTVRSFIYLIDEQILTEEEARKSAMLRVDESSTLAVSANNTTLTPMVSCDLPLLSAELALNAAGGLMLRIPFNNYIDTDQFSFFYQYPGKTTTGDPSTMTNAFLMEASMEKTIYLPAKVIVNSLIFYGSGDIEVSVNPDQRGYTAERTVTLSEQGTAFVLNQHCSLFTFKVRHITDIDIDLSKIEVKVTALSNVNIKNDTTAGV